MAIAAPNTAAVNPMLSAALRQFPKLLSMAHLQRTDES